MNESYSASYAAAGVDITAGYRAVELMKQHAPAGLSKGYCLQGALGLTVHSAN
mgnify:CR=1 FL=1